MGQNKNRRTQNPAKNKFSIGKNKSTQKNHKGENPKIKTLRKFYLQIKTCLQ